MPPKRKRKAAATATPAVPTTAAGGGTSTTDLPDIGVVRVKNGAAVNRHCSLANTHHVYSDPDGIIWDFLGTQTNIANNNNKYYVIQLLQQDSGNTFACYSRWGRVGYKGQESFLSSPGSSLDACKQAFSRKFAAKTGYSWEEKDSIVTPKSGKYMPVAVAYADDTEDNDEGSKPKKNKGDKELPKPPPPSQLEPKLQSLMQLIFNVKHFTEQIVEMRFDVNKMPLGKLTNDQLRLGMEALSQVEQAIRGNGNLREACNLFYVRVPHDFGMRRPHPIETLAQVKEKLDMLELLGDIKTTMTILKEEMEVSMAEEDRVFQQLDTGITPVTSEDRDLIEKYIKNTHGSTHNSYTLELEDAFEVDKSSLPTKKRPKKRMLLWHGSRLSNWSGILKQGLRIAPPEAPVTGYMFGKGVYFADAVSKSANYCFTDRTNNTGLLLLCEVEVGNEKDQLRMFDSDHLLHEKFPKNKKVCTIGLGAEEPDPSGAVELDGVTVPCGKMKKTGRKSPGGGYTLQYNEYIVYDLKQIRLKYLCRVKFHYGKRRW